MKTEEATELGMGVFALIGVCLIIFVIGWVIYDIIFIHPNYITEFDWHDALTANYWEEEK